MPGWRNWQTRRTQNPVLAREWEFDPPSGHHRFRHCRRAMWDFHKSSVRILREQNSKNVGIFPG